jgi:tRNA(Arg) A34 adenosine deaminase TadA
MRTTLRQAFAILALLLMALDGRGAPTAASPDDRACTQEDRVYMARAHELAQSATTHGGGPFCALLVKDGKILAEFSNCVHFAHDMTKHAETGLISAFSPKIDRETFAKSTLYTSTEPCAMCRGAICFAGIGRVVYGVSEAPFERTMGLTPAGGLMASREIPGRISPRTKVARPLMEKEGLKLHQEYWSAHPENVGKS